MELTPNSSNRYKYQRIPDTYECNSVNGDLGDINDIESLQEFDSSKFDQMNRIKYCIYILGSLIVLGIVSMQLIVVEDSIDLDEMIVLSTSREGLLLDERSIYSFATVNATLDESIDSYLFVDVNIKYQEIIGFGKHI